MPTSFDERRQKVVKLVQELLLEEEDRSAVTPALILREIEKVLALNPRWAVDFDRDGAVDELIRRFSVWIGSDTSLTDAVGHVPWFDPTKKRDWRYWRRYQEWLERRLSWKAIESLDRSTDEVLRLLEEPTRGGSWDRRGLVVGHVQSGKTANYIGLISKAADSGYKIIIVLAGLHNNLRSQTQIRLEEGFLGYQTPQTHDTVRMLGVGEIDSDRNIYPNCATNRMDNGDFSTETGRHLAVTPEARPWLFVVKKNKTVLSALLKWIQNRAADASRLPAECPPMPGDYLPRVTKLVTGLPLLVIDDEADQASVDTQEQLFDADGRPDEEHSPTTINRLIRRILNSFTRSAYVGYTATPFANIFIHERATTRGEGPDLFPSSFIINLAAPSNYVGPTMVFGVPFPEGRQGGLPLVRFIKDCTGPGGPGGWMPPRHRNGHLPRYGGEDTMPPSLAEAIDSFLLACSSRRVQGQSAEHSSMLIHVTRFNSVQREVYRQVDEHLSHIRQRIYRQIGHREIEARLKVLWDGDFVPTSARVRQSRPEQTSSRSPSWRAICDVLPDVLAELEIKTVNGSAGDVLDYSNRMGTGLKVIVIGGDKLARGLTLEGLCVSYFLRASKMYDTLMQMGRWFGYRPGYLDMCRLYTTPELYDWFGHIADASEELREEFELMAANGATPRDYGLKVQSHSSLLVTSPLKMRTAKELRLSFSGELLETVVFYKNPEQLERNLVAAKKLIGLMGPPTEKDPVRKTATGEAKWKGYLWRRIRALDVIEFLNSYETHPLSHKVRSRLLAQFIASMNDVQELTWWTVALIGGGSGGPWKVTDGIMVDMIQRSSSGQYDDRYSIGRLLSPRDEAIDADRALWEAALVETQRAWKPDAARVPEGRLPEVPDAPNGLALRRVRGEGAEGVAATRDTGLLLLYAIDPKLANTEFANDEIPVVAFGASFPGSNAGRKVVYKVNSVEWRRWEREYGPAQ